MSELSVNLFDPSAVEELAELAGSDDENLLVELFHLYSKTTPALIQKIEEAFASNKSDEIRKIAHSLKSSSASLGLLKLRDLCSYIEKEAAKIVLNKNSQVLFDLKPCYEISIKLLLNYIQQKNLRGKVA